MTARMTMGGTGYLYVYPGTGAEAEKAEEKDRIPYETRGLPRSSSKTAT